jgi:hypothetical protein
VGDPALQIGSGRRQRRQPRARLPGVSVAEVDVPLGRFLGNLLQRDEHLLVARRRRLPGWRGGLGLRRSDQNGTPADRGQNDKAMPHRDASSNGATDDRKN